MSIFVSLAKVQKTLKVNKGQYNSFGNYKYRSCEDIVEAVKPLCIKHNMVLFMSDAIELIGDRHYVVATVTLVDTETGEQHSVKGYARESLVKKGMDDSQVTGATSSYARKYALNGLFCIDDTKDADTNEYANQTKDKGNDKKNTTSYNKNTTSTNSKTTQTAPPKNTPPTNKPAKPEPSQKTKTMLELATKNGVTRQDIFNSLQKDYKKTTIDSLTDSEYKELSDRIGTTK